MNKLILFLFGGLSYFIIEILWRGYSHWSMFLLGGLCFLLIGLLNERLMQNTPIIPQALIGAFIITALEFIAGCILNIHLELDVWDYYDMPFNILGQICLPYSILWVILSLVCIVFDDYLRYMFLGGEKPQYKII